MLAPTMDKEVVDIRGIKIPIHPAVMSPAVLYTIRNGTYEGLEARLFLQILEPGERLVEIGGGIGFLSALAGSERKAETITVFEANPDLLPVIEETHRMNGTDASVRNAAIVSVAHAPSVPLYVHKDLWSSSLLKPQAEVKFIVEVPALELVAVLDELRPTLLVVDIEGTELDLIASVELAGVNKLFVELHPPTIGASGIKLIFDRLSSQEFAYDPKHSAGNVILFRRIVAN